MYENAYGASLSLPAEAANGSGPAASMLAGGVVRPEFNLAGHALIAYLAERYLEQNDHDVWQALQTVKGGDPLGRGDIGTFATWPDLLKHPRSGAKPSLPRKRSDSAVTRRICTTSTFRTNSTIPTPSTTLRRSPGICSSKCPA